MDKLKHGGDRHPKRLRRTVMCTKRKVKCYKMDDEDEYCESYPKHCREPGQVFMGVFNGTYVENEFSWENAIEESHTDKIIEYCSKVVEGATIPCEKRLRRVPVVTSAGEPNMCYTVESQWEEPDAVPDIYPNTFSFDIGLLSEPDEYLIDTEPVLIQTSVHDRRRLVSPYAKGFALHAGVEYEAYVSMTEKQLLPAPYDTNCTDYIKLWKQKGGTGPLNELMCIEYCKLSTLLAEGKCIDKNVAYPHMEPLCKRDQVTVTSAIIEKCTEKCASPCIDHVYEVRYEEVNNYGHVCNNEWCKFARINLSIFFKRFRVTRFIYQPKFESVEMFSYIGGYMGMWLGLSLVSFFDLFETLSYLIYFPIGRKMWQSRRHKYRHHDGYGNNAYYHGY